MNEEWKVVADFPDYEVSNVGRVRNRRTGRIRKQADDARGYFAVGLRKGGVSSTQKVHRLVAIAFLDQPSRDHNQVNHINGIKQDNRVSNLEWCTASQNSKHAIRMGLASPPPIQDSIQRGSANGATKLSKTDVLRIRELYACGVRVTELTKLYPVSQSQISRVVHHVHWSYVPMEAE